MSFTCIENNKMKLKIQLIERDLVPFLYQEVQNDKDLCSGKLGTYGDALCEQCGHAKCNGHTGYIDLDFLMPHPLFVSLVTRLASCFCCECKSLIKTDINVNDFNDYYEIISDKEYPCTCECSTPSFLELKFEAKYNPQTKEFSTDSSANNGFKMKNKNKELYSYTLEDIDEMFNSLSVGDIVKLGFSNDFNPKDLLINYIPVLMNVARSGLMADGGMDYLTKIYSGILTELKNEKKNGVSQIKIFNMFSTLIGKKSESGGIQMLRHMLSGKTGLMRNSLMSVRQNRSARTVISPGLDIPLTHVGVPDKFKNRLTVFHYIPKGATNFDSYIQYIHSDDFVNNGNIRMKLSLNKVSKNKLSKLLAQYNDGTYYTERCLRNDDWVYINRQPTLHRHSILAFKARLTDHNTISLNLACVTAFNADFDGDEMTLYVASDKGSIRECRDVMSIEHNMISPENKSLVICPVQDCVTAVYMMTRDDIKFTKEQSDYFFASTSRELFKYKLPDFFKFKENYPITKKDLYALIVDVINQCGSSEALAFIDRLQSTGNKWLQVFPVSIGYFDFAMFDDDEVNDIMKVFYEDNKQKVLDAELAKEEFPEYANDIEKKIAMFLDSTVKDGICKALKLEERKDNDLVNIVMSGSKGKKLDVVQGSVALCQQYFNGRQQPIIGVDQSSIDPEDKGFVRSSYSRGLNQKELFYQATAARATIVSTGVNTADPGYLQRQLSRYMADVHTDSEGNVINHAGMVIM